MSREFRTDKILFNRNSNGPGWEWASAEAGLHQGLRESDSIGLPWDQTCKTMDVTAESLICEQPQRALPGKVQNAVIERFSLTSITPESKAKASSDDTGDEDEQSLLAGQDRPEDSLSPVSGNVYTSGTLFHQEYERCLVRLGDLGNPVWGSNSPPPIFTTPSATSPNGIGGPTQVFEAPRLSPTITGPEVVVRDKMAFPKAPTPLRPRRSVIAQYLDDYCWRRGLEGSFISSNVQLGASTARDLDELHDSFDTVQSTPTVTHIQTLVDWPAVHSSNSRLWADLLQSQSYNVQRDSNIHFGEKTVTDHCCPQQLEKRKLAPPPSPHTGPVQNMHDQASCPYAHALHLTAGLRGSVNPGRAVTYPIGPKLEGTAQHAETTSNVLTPYWQGAGEASDADNNLYRTMSWHEQSEFDPSPHASPCLTKKEITQKNCKETISTLPLSRSDHALHTQRHPSSASNRHSSSHPTPKCITSITAQNFRGSGQIQVHEAEPACLSQQVMLGILQQPIDDLSTNATTQGHSERGLTTKNEVMPKKDGKAAGGQKQAHPYVKIKRFSHSPTLAPKVGCFSWQKGTQPVNMLPQRPKTVTATRRPLRPVPLFDVDRPEDPICRQTAHIHPSRLKVQSSSRMFSHG